MSYERSLVQSRVSDNTLGQGVSVIFVTLDPGVVKGSPIMLEYHRALIGWDVSILMLFTG